MTTLTERKTKLKFETADTVRYRGRLREVIIETTPYMAVVRLKGTRQRFEMSWGGVFNHAVKVSVDAQRAAKKKSKGKR